MLREPRSKFLRYAFGYYDQKPGVVWWAFLIAMVLFILFNLVSTQ